MKKGETLLGAVYSAERRYLCTKKPYTGKPAYALAVIRRWRRHEQQVCDGFRWLPD